MSLRHLDALFSPHSVLILGAPDTSASRRTLANVERSLAAELRTLVGAQRPGWVSAAGDAALPAGDLAIVLDPAWLQPLTAHRLHAAGCRAVIVIPAAADPLAVSAFLQQCRALRLRVLGPGTGGVVSNVTGRNLSAFALEPLQGSVALITQSYSLASAALDWAAGRQIGFSWIATTAEEADVDVADLLDHAALDLRTRTVVLQLDRIAAGRQFMSAARACARSKPVVVLQTSTVGSGPLSPSDRVRSAAFRRAGLVECDSMAGLFDALAALERLPPPRGEQVLVVGNGAGVCAMGADALLRLDLQLHRPDDTVRQAIHAVAPQVSIGEGWINTGTAADAQVVQVLAAVLGANACDAIVFVRGPNSEKGHDHAARALVAANFGTRVLSVWLGLQTAQNARTLCAASGLATFTTADAAARALRYRWQNRRTQEELTQTPAIDSQGLVQAGMIGDLFRGHLDSGRLQLAGDAAAQVLEVAGLPSAGAASALAPMAVEVATHRELGLCLRLQARAPGLDTPVAYALPPLDDLLARRALAEAGFRDDGCTHAALEGMARQLVVMGDLVAQQSPIAGGTIELAADAAGACWLRPGSTLQLTSTPLPPRRRLALAAFPAHMSCHLPSRTGEEIAYRPVKPSDEAALLTLLTNMPAEDIRLRFFIYMRHFTHAMAARMTQIDYDREISLVAFPAGRPAEMVAIATIIADADGARAEFAVLVRHEYAGTGIGGSIMRQLLAEAWRRGVGCVFGEILRGNQNMRRLASRLGFKETGGDADCVHVEIFAPQAVAELA